MAREAIFPEGRQEVYERYGYSAAIRSGDLLFVSGQVGSKDDGTAIVDPQAQLEKAFANLDAVLSAAGCGLDDVVDVTSFHVEMHEHFDVFAKVKQDVFPNKPFPNWTAVGVTCLADPALLFEIKVIARLV